MRASAKEQTRGLDFEAHLFNTLKSSRFNCHDDNYDIFFRGPMPKKETWYIKFIGGIKELFSGQPHALSVKVRAFNLVCSLNSLVNYHFFPKHYFKSAVDQYKKFGFLYQKLEDSISRDLLISLLAYRFMGFRKIKLARNSPLYWEGIEKAKRLDTGLPIIRVPLLTWPLLCFDVNPLGFHMRVYTYAQAIAINFVQKQYVLERGSVVCKATPGDVVIDAGACWGDTSLQFACEVGSAGHVYAFEFVPNNLKVLYKNIELNPHLASLITIVENPVGAQSGSNMYYLENGPASRVASSKVDERYIECAVLSIDQLVANKKIERVDFIKMDVEGSELDALRGAEKTIRKFMPKLAICIYHKLDDYISIPKFLSELQLGYRFYIEHHTIFLGETVLFAIPPSHALP